MLGYSREELNQKTWQMLTPPEDIERIQAQLYQLLRGEQDSLRFTKRFIRKDGSLIWADVSTALLGDEAGNPQHFITTILDITEQRRISEAERELAHRIDAGLRAGNLAWWEMELPSGMVAFDDRKAEMLGYSPKKFKTYEDFTRLLHPDDHPRAMQAMRDHLEGRKEYYEVKYRIKNRSGKYNWFRDIGALAEDGGDNSMRRVIGIVEDITNRKFAELELEKYSNRLEQLVAERTAELEKTQQELIIREKLATLGQLAGGVGHELRNPLGVISNAVYILKAITPPENEKAAEYIQMISDQVQRSNKIISDLLNFAREPGVNKRDISISDVVRQALSMTPRAENISVDCRISENLPLVHADQQHLEQILSNLISNACQAMPQGGKLTIRAGQSGNEVKVSVIDQGTGISPENLKKLFTPLFTTKTRGIGLGLATSKKLAQANGVSIKVKSREGKGSTFTLILPVHS